MIAITATDIREVIQTNLDDPILDNCGVMAAHICEEAWKRCKKRPTSEVAYIVIRYLAAHFCALREPPILNEHLPEGVSATYDANSIFKASAKGLLSTIWGQTALAIDPTGCLHDKTTDPLPNLYILNGLTTV